MSARCPIHHIQSEKKMNKEQKSFGEYGAAWATTVVIHTYIRSLLKYRGTPLSPDALHTYRDKVLKEAWRWRRICRNITNKKNCGIRN